MPKKSVCFFSNASKEQLQKEQYSIQDLRILDELGFNVIIATSFAEIPMGCDLYFSWWASGSILPLIKAKISGKPIIVIAGGHEANLCRDSVTGEPRGYLATPPHKKLATRVTLRMGTRILVVSNYMVKDAVALGAKAPIVVPNSVDTDAFKPNGSIRHGILSIFNLSRAALGIKRAEVFIRAIPRVLERFPEESFTIIGRKGDATEQMSALASDLGIKDRLTFLGAINNSEVSAWMRQVKAYVQISDSETFGVAIAEAMSSGTPVVVSRRASIPEVVGVYGIYVDHNDPESVAAGIVGLLTKAQIERDGIGAKLRQRVLENYTYEKRRESIADIIRPLLQA